MKKWTKRILWMMLALLLLFSTNAFPGAGQNTNTVEAASKKQQKKAKAAFRKFLSQKQIRWAKSSNYYDRSKFRFRYMTVGSSNIPILILSGGTFHYEGYYAVYVYKNGKVTCIGVNDGIGKIYKKAGILTMWHTGGGYGETNTWYYRVTKSGTLKQIAYTAILNSIYESSRSVFGDDIYKINGKKVSKKTFRKKLKQWTGSSTIPNVTTSVSTYKNTAANRKKYLS